MHVVTQRATKQSAWDAALAEGRARAAGRGIPVLVSVTRRVADQDALAFFMSGAGQVADRAYWAQPETGWARAGLGAAQVFTAEGPTRFAAVDQAWRTLLSTAIIRPAPDVSGLGPTLLGGFAFDPQRPTSAVWTGYPAARLVLPRRLLHTTPTGSWLTTSAIVGGMEREQAGEQQAQQAATQHATRNTLPPPPTRAEWEALVTQAAAAVRAGGLEKVVLARRAEVTSDTPFDTGAVLARLRAGYPNCSVFAIARGPRLFLGASPERLVRAEAGRVAVACLAGSIARGSDAASDAAQGAALLHSVKDREEHAIVARMLAETLAAACDDVQMPATPGLLRLPNVQHLYTPVTARLRPGSTLLDLVGRLHPTPAVGGAPREAALAWLRAHEGLDRGWYAAPVGWLDATGDGEFAVALRSGLVDGASAQLFAGCGIVGPSIPAAEWAESELKLRPMRDALGQPRT